MKHIIKNSLLTLVIASAPLATYANEDSSEKVAVNLPTYTIEDIAALPEPTKSPTPSVQAQFVGLNLQVKFTVNTKGEAESVRLVKPLSSYSDVDRMTFASQMKDAIEKWNFEPATDVDGNPITVKVIMPIQVVKKDSKPVALASLALDTSYLR